MMRWLDVWAARLMWVPRVLIVAGVLSLMVFALDRREPFAVLEVPDVSVHPGDYLKITATVRREPDRRCDADFSRYLYTSDGTRYDLGSSFASHKMIAASELRTPGKLTLGVLIPNTAAPGMARIDTVLFYRCNKIHAIWPIQVTTEIPFRIESRPAPF